MANYHIKKTSIISGDDVYFKGGDSWTSTYADRKQYTNRTTANNQKNSTVTFNGITYTPKFWANSTVVTE